MHIELFQCLPYDIKDIIWDMLDTRVKSSLDRRHFSEHNYEHYNSMHRHDQYGYNRVMIRNDDSFVFENIISNYGREWLSNKKYVYDNRVHSNYLYFLISLIYENKSSRCNEVITRFLNKEGLSKNLYKKYRIKNIRWSN